MGPPVRLQRPYIRPVKVALVTNECFLGLQKPREDVPGEVEEGVLGNVLEGARLEYVDTGVSQGTNSLPRNRLFLKAHDVVLLVDLDHSEL